MTGSGNAARVPGWQGHDEAPQSPGGAFGGGMAGGDSAAHHGLPQHDRDDRLHFAEDGPGGDTYANMVGGNENDVPQSALDDGRYSGDSGHEDYEPGDGDEYQNDDHHDAIPERRPVSMGVKVGFGVGAATVVGMMLFVLVMVFTKHQNGGDAETSHATVEPQQTGSPKIASDPMTDMARPRAPATGGQDQAAPMDAGVPAGQIGERARGDAGGAMQGGGSQAMMQAPPSPAAASAEAVQALTGDIQSVKSSLAETNAGLVARIDALAATVNLLAGRIGDVDGQVQALKPPVRATTKTKSSRRHDGPPRQPKPEVVATADHGADAPESKRRQHNEKRAAASGAPHCVLRGGTDGLFEQDKKPKAWIATDSGDLAPPAAVGDPAPCIGLVRSIDADGDDWVVVGSKGTLRMHASGEGQ